MVEEYTEKMENVYLEPTELIESKSREIVETAERITSGLKNETEKTKALFYFVRDKISFRPLFFNYLPKEEFKATRTLKRGYGFCIMKAILLISLLRAVGIPSRLVLAEIRHHQLPDRIKNVLRTNVLPHGFLEAFLKGRWVKLNPTFDAEYCKAMGYIPTEFDGERDALFNPVDKRGRKLIDYVSIIGTFPDFPYELLIKYIKENYGTLDVESLRKINSGEQFYRNWF